MQRPRITRMIGQSLLRRPPLAIFAEWWLSWHHEPLRGWLPPFQGHRRWRTGHHHVRIAQILFHGGLWSTSWRDKMLWLILWLLLLDGRQCFLLSFCWRHFHSSDEILVLLVLITIHLDGMIGHIGFRFLGKKLSIKLLSPRFQIGDLLLLTLCRIETSKLPTGLHLEILPTQGWSYVKKPIFIVEEALIDDRRVEIHWSLVSIAWCEDGMLVKVCAHALEKPVPVCTVLLKVLAKTLPSWLFFLI